MNPYQAPQTGSEQTESARPPCPKCNEKNAATVAFTWWGGVLGPRLFNVVSCQRCGTQYNGKTGGRLTRVIVGYQLTFLVLLLALGLWASRFIR
jgi:hypothetical protein